MNDTTSESKQVVTPEQAQAWLSENPNNRNINIKHVERLARDMLEGVFAYNGDTIKFDGDGKLMDGQHRLSAVVASGTSQPMLIVRGVSEDARKTIDRGEKRTVAHWLKMKGFSNCTTLGHAAHLLHVFESGLLQQINATGKFHPVDADAVLANHPKLYDSVLFAVTLKQSVSGTYNSTGAIGFLHYLFSYVDARKADEFFEGLDTGLNLSKGSPIAALKNKLTKVNSNTQQKMPPTVKMAYVLKAWSDFIQNRKIQRLQLGASTHHFVVEGFRYSGNKPIFPKIP